MMLGTYRMIDANINRVQEGIRVVEDVLRFGRNELKGGLKELRNKVVNLRNLIPGQYLMGARDSGGDAGLKSSGEGESKRNSDIDLIRAGFNRAKEGMRVIEEGIKLLELENNEDTLQHIKSIRAELYDIERDVLAAYDKAWMQHMGLYFIADHGTLDNRLLEVCDQALEGGADVLQLRCKGLDDKRLLALARKVRALTKKHGVPLIIDDRADIAVLVGAEGVHLGQSDLGPGEVRKLYGSMLAIGMSVHNDEEMKRALEQGPDYLGIGPVFSSATKGKHIEALGVEGTMELAKLWKGPWVSIGGIGRENIEKILRAGIRNIAVISAVSHADSPEEDTRELKQALEQGDGNDNG